MSSKREDLQGIRGLAIFAVLLFHFFPKIFPNGYVGVDQFFILSGFLMAKILAKESAITFNATIFFYYRRMKRILPLYALFIFLTLSFSLLLFERTVFYFNIIHAIRSLFFISNTETADKDLDYERFLANADILFTHTWSLSAEVQFYAIAPFMILTSIYVSTNFFIAIISFICLLSFVAFSILLEDETTKSFAFNSMVTRIWQFALGILCCFMARKLNKPAKSDPGQGIEKLPLIESFMPEDSNNKQQELSDNIVEVISCLLLLLSAVGTFSAYVINQLPLRLIVCISTTLLIYIGHFNTNYFLSLRPLVYLGDISYSLYLVHWPIYVYVKQSYESDIIAIFTGIAVSVLLAILSTEIYEKFYLQQSKIFLISLCTVLYISSFCILFIMMPTDVYAETPEDPNILWSKPANLTNDQIIALNDQFNIGERPQVIKTEAECDLIQNIHGTKYCKFNNTEYTGNNRIMLIGNSFAKNIGRMFLKEKNCKEKANDIYMFSVNTCEVLEDGSRYWSPCENSNLAHMEAVNRTRPEYLFILTRHFVSMFPSDTTVDPILKEELEHIAILEKLVSKKIFILDAVPRTEVHKIKWPDVLNEAIRNKQPLPSNADLLDKKANYEIARKRTRQVVDKCSKCELIDVKPIFMKNNVFQHYDENDKLIHFVSSLHFSNYGLMKIKPIFSQICKQFK